MRCDRCHDAEICFAIDSGRMKLPDSHLVRIDRVKLTDYLLNPWHPGNGGKAKFFISLGYSARHWQLLEAALRKAAQSGEVLRILSSPFGRKYIQTGWIVSPNNTATKVIRMIWVTENNLRPRLVTTYPEREVHDA
jgi:hypothetical protein